MRRFCIPFIFIFLIFSLPAYGEQGDPPFIPKKKLLNFKVNMASLIKLPKSLASRHYKETRMFKIKNKDNFLIFDVEYEVNKRKLNSSDISLSRKRKLFREALEMNFNGFVFHPKFMNFDLSATIAPEQQKEETGFDSDSGKFRKGYLSQYRLSSVFLQEKLINFSLHTYKQQGTQNRNFFERQIIDSFGYGGTIGFRSAHVPMRLSYSISERDVLSSFRGQQGFDDERVSLQVEPRIERAGRLKLDYTRNKYHYVENRQTDQEGVTDNLTLYNQYFIGKTKDKNLTSFLRYYSLQGDNANDEISLNESLRIKHNKHLEGIYTYSFSDMSVGEINIQEQNFNGSLTHQLYKSLTSLFKLQGTLLDSTSFNEKRYGAFWDEKYHKKIGPAILRLGTAYAYEDNARESRGKMRVITGEEQILSDSSIVLLNESGVDISTINVTNSIGTITYTLDSDYKIIKHPQDRVEIKRTLGGNIADGDEILVNYIADQNFNFNFTTVNKRFNFSLGFNDETVRFYYNIGKQGYPNIDGGENTVLEKFKDTVLGTELKTDNAYLSVEYEDYNSNLIPRTSVRLREELRLKIFRRGEFNLRLSQDYITLSDEKRKNYEIKSDYSLRLSPSVVYRTETGFRVQKGNRSDIKEFTLRSAYRVYKGRFFFELRYEYEARFSLNDTSYNHYIYTKLKKKF